MELLDALLLIKEKALTGDIDELESGICYCLSILTDSVDFAHDFVRDNCEDWEYFSGDINYPIEGYKIGNLWKGEQLKLRLSLLDHLITKAYDLNLTSTFNDH